MEANISKPVEVNMATLVDAKSENQTSVIKTQKQTEKEQTSSDVSVETTHLKTAEYALLESQATTFKASASYEAFDGKFCAEKLPIFSDSEKDIYKHQNSADEASTSDDVSTLYDEENIANVVDSKKYSKKMPQRLKSRYQDRMEVFELDRNEFANKLQAKPTRPQSAGGVNKWLERMVQVEENKTHFPGDQFGETKNKKYRSTRLKKYNSTGDLRSTDQRAARRRRQLPDLTMYQNFTSDSEQGHEFDPTACSEAIVVPSTPRDRETLEAHFKLLYKENIRLEKAYEELQNKVKKERPEIFSGKEFDFRETAWQIEKKKLLKEIRQLTKKIERANTSADDKPESHRNSSLSENLSPTSEKSEMHFKEKLQRLQTVKDDEIARLSEQVAYWMTFSEEQANDKPMISTKKSFKNIQHERIAKLEQSESLLKCQVINLEDQLAQTKTDLATAKNENDDLAEHCNKLEGCLAIIDAEKSLLDDLKSQNMTLRKKLAKVEDDEKILIDKLAEMAEENAELQSQSSLARTNDEHEISRRMDSLVVENKQLQDSLTTSKDRCSGLEDLKECLVQQIKSMEENFNSESSRFKEQIQELKKKLQTFKEEQESQSESKEQLEVDLELKANMNENLNKRILDLQSHIETLKSQLENEKQKVILHEKVQEQLDTALTDKCTVEALCSKYKSEVEEIQSKLTDQQVRLTESFDEANTQLMEETNEMATRQRHLLTENYQLRARACVLGFDAVIGAKLREELQSVVQTALHEVDVSRRNPTLLPGEASGLLCTPQLTDDQANDLLNNYARELVGATVTELRHLEDESPRLKDVPTLRQLIDNVKENHRLLASVERIKDFISNLNKDAETENKQQINRVSEEELNELKADKEALQVELKATQKTCGELELRMQSMQEEKFRLIQSAEEDISNSKLEKISKLLKQVQDENNDLQQELQDEKSRSTLLEKNFVQDIDALKNDLSSSRRSESTLRKSLDETQKAGENLISRVQVMKDERCAIAESHEKELTSLNQTIQSKTNELLQIKEKHKKDIHLMEGEIDDLSSKLDTAKQKNIELQAEVAEKCRIISEQNDVCLKQQKDCAEMKIKLDSLQNEKHIYYSQSHEEIAQLKEELNQSVMISRNQETLVLEKDRNIEDANKRLQEYEEMLKEQKQSAENKQQKLKEEIKSLKKTILELEKKMSLNQLNNSVKKSGDVETSNIQSYSGNFSLPEEEKEFRIDTNVREKEKSKLLVSENKNLQHKIMCLDECLSKEKLARMKAEKEHEASLKAVRKLTQELCATNRSSYHPGNVALQISMTDERESSNDLRLKGEAEESEKLGKLDIPSNIHKAIENELECFRQAMKNMLQIPTELKRKVTDQKHSIASSKKHNIEKKLNDFEYGRSNSQGAEYMPNKKINRVFLNTINDGSAETENHVKTCKNEEDNESSELECLRKKCLNLELQLNDKEAVRRIPETAVDIDSSVDVNLDENSTLVGAKRIMEDQDKIVQSEDTDIESSSQSSVPKLTQSDYDVASLKSNELNSESGSVSATESNQIESSLNMISVDEVNEENKRLKDKIHELEFSLENMEKASKSLDPLPRLQLDNQRLMGLLDQAGKKACSAQDEQSRMKDVIEELQMKLNAFECSEQPEVDESASMLIEALSGREEDRRKMDNLHLQLQETECLVVAHKNKLHHVEDLNSDLKLENRKLSDKIADLEKALQLPEHPVIEQLRAEMCQARMSQTAPASVHFDEDMTPRGSWTEEETIPLDGLMAALCDKVTGAEKCLSKSQMEKEKLSSTLQQIRQQLTTVEERNACLEREAENVHERLQNTEKLLDDEQDKAKALGDLLSMNDANSKENIRSKEEDIEKLQSQLLSISLDFETKSIKVKELENERSCLSEEFGRKIGEMEKTVATLSENLEHKAKESQHLLSQTIMLGRKESEITEELKMKEKELALLKHQMHSLERENASKTEMAEKSSTAHKLLNEKLNSTVKIQDDTIRHLRGQLDSLEESTNQLRDTMRIREENIATLSSELSEKEEAIEVLSARVDELVETEEALKTTMDSADVIIAEREKQHLSEVEKLKDGLNRTMSEVKCAEMTTEELLEQINGLEEENEKLKSEIDGMKKEENDAAYQIESMEMERALINTSLENAREESGELAETNQQLIQENSDLNEAIDQLQSTIEELNSQLADLHNECDDHTQLVKEKESEISDLLNKISRMERQQGDSEDHCNLNNKRSSQSNGNVHSELEETRTQLFHMRKIVEEMRFDKAHLESEVYKMKMEYDGPPITSFKNPSMKMNSGVSKEMYEPVSDASNLTDREDYLPDLAMRQMTSRLQEESVSLRSENEALRSKIASLEGSITEMTERLVPKLELGSIVDESEAKIKDNHLADDDTGRYVDDIDTTRATGISKVELLEEKLRLSEEVGAKLILQIQEMEEEADSLRNNLQELSRKNETLQHEFFETISENFQTQIDDLTRANTSLEGELKKKSEELNSKEETLQQVLSTESQWRHRYKEVQEATEELRQQLLQAEDDNHDLQCRLADLDYECQSILHQNDDDHLKSENRRNNADPPTVDAISQTLSVTELIQELRENKHILSKGSPDDDAKEDTEDDISDIKSSSSSSSSSHHSFPLNVSSKQLGATNLAEDELLQRSILRERGEVFEEPFDLGELPDPITETISNPHQTTDPSLSSSTAIKSLQNEVVGYQLIIEKLKRRNQDLLDGAGAAMTQDDKEALEREVSALRGQVALLERNNKLFSDRERNELKQDLDLATKRSNNFQAQLKQIKASLEYEEVEKLKEQLRNAANEVEDLKKQLRECEEDDSGSDSSSQSSNSHPSNKYARLLELEEEAEELKSKLEEREEDLKDRDVMVEELQHRLRNILKQHAEEVAEIEKRNDGKQEELKEEIKELEREIVEKKEMIKLKQTNLQNKSAQLDTCEDEIEKLEKDVQKKNKEIERLHWEVEDLKKENASLRDRIERLKEAISASSDPALLDISFSPTLTYRSPPCSPFASPSRSRSSTLRSSFRDHPDARNSDSINRNSNSIRSSSVPAFDERHEPLRARRAYSFDRDEGSPTSALREGIHEAKETVHQMGDVLDTPRLTPRRRNSLSKLESGFPSVLLPLTDISPKSFTQKKSNRNKWRNKSDMSTDEEDESKNVDKIKDISDDKENQSRSTVSSSNSSQSSSENDESEKEEIDETSTLAEPTQLRKLTTPTEDDTEAIEKQDMANRNKKKDEEFSAPSANSKRKIRQKELTESVKNRSLSLSSDTSSIEEKDGSVKPETTIDGILATSPVNPSRSRTSSSSSSNSSLTRTKGFVISETIDGATANTEANPNTHIASTDIIPTSSDSENKDSDNSNDDSTSNKKPKKGNDDNTEEVPHESLDEGSSGSNEFMGRDSSQGVNTSSKPSVVEEEEELFGSRTKPEANVSLLPDDRPTLIQEVTKAREEARKWFTEVTQSDRDKRQLSRRLEALENELVRLKEVEDNYEVMKRNQEEIQRVSRDLEKVRTEAEAANKKAEEARERNALLKAHLLDKEEVENQNKELKKRVEEMKRSNTKKKPSEARPLSELQETPKSNQKENALSRNFSALNQKEILDIKDGFEYIATNFADLVLKKHDAELALAPEQAKVSKLKRKCAERDDVLAKLVLKLRQKSNSTNDIDDSADDSSIASSIGLERILHEADQIINPKVKEEETSDSTCSSIRSSYRSPKRRNRKDGEEKEVLPPSSRHLSGLVRNLSSKSLAQSEPPPAHRIFIAKHDYAPSSRTLSPNTDSSLPITQSLLPDLPLLSGDTVVAIGNPDKREDGKMYQMAEVRGKIGFVPLAHLVAAEQVEGMQAFVQDRGKTERKKTSSSPEKIVDLYKKLEQAQLIVADKIDRKSKGALPRSPIYNDSSRLRQRKDSSSSTATNDFTTEYTSSMTSVTHGLSPDRKRKIRSQPFKSNASRNLDSSSRNQSGSDSSFREKSGSTSRSTRESKPTKKYPRKKDDPKLENNFKRVDSGRDFQPIFDSNGSAPIRTSTPIQSHSSKASHQSRSSSLPSKRSSSSWSAKSEKSSPGHFESPSHEEKSSSSGHKVRSRSRNKDKPPRSSNNSFLSSSSSQASPIMTLPQPPTFLVIEKTMGQKSMIICWTPPLLDMISRSNNVPVIGYEISVDKIRKVQVSGAYTNKAILGDLDLRKTLFVEVRTVSSVGTLSSPCEIIFTPDIQSSSSLGPQNGATNNERSSVNSKTSNTSKISREDLHHATALYDYDPNVDSPYNSHPDEIPLAQGDDVIVLGSPRPDGFCDVQVGNRRGFAPIAFLISDGDETITSSDLSFKNPAQQKSKQKKKPKKHVKSSERYWSSDSSYHR